MATANVQAAVAALKNAGDVEGLASAIDHAAFLDAIPGEDRQKLRGACVRAGAHVAGLLPRRWLPMLSPGS